MGGPKSQEQLRSAYSEALAMLRAGRFATAERRLRVIQTSASGDVFEACADVGGGNEVGLFLVPRARSVDSGSGT